MELKLAYPTIGAVLSLAVVWFWAAGMGAVRLGACADERRAFFRLVWPVLAGAGAHVFVTGWAMREPNPADESVTLLFCAFAGVACGIALRAITRAVRALRAIHGVSPPIATVGVLSSRIVVSERFRQVASREVLDAALAHESAHANARDPLRIWIAQLATDLQWPIPGAGRRLKAWLLSLELRRDDEAVAAGACRVALAESILLAATLTARSQEVPVAAVAGDGSGLAFRVRRLLGAAPLGVVAQSGLGRLWLTAIAAILSMACLGATYGDLVLSVLPGIGR